jgi:hypothetical protein
MNSELENSELKNSEYPGFQGELDIERTEAEGTRCTEYSLRRSILDDPIAHAARKVLSSIQLRGARDGPEIFAPIQERLHHQPNLLQHDIRLTSVRKQKSCTKSRFIWCRLIVKDRKWLKGSEFFPYQPLAPY